MNAGLSAVSMEGGLGLSCNHDNTCYLPVFFFGGRVGQGLNPEAINL